MSESNSRRCNTCRQEKPLTEFYDYQTRCKSCMYTVNKERRKSNSPKEKLNSIFGSEALVIQELRSRKIPAYPGKAVSFALVDVVAWGCVGIEVKSSQFHVDSYQWGFSSKQLTALQSDVIALVTLDDTPEFYLFPANHPVFFINGKRKHAVSYQPEPYIRRHHDRYVMTDADMREARDRWSLVETAKEAFCEQLVQGVAFPKWIR